MISGIVLAYASGYDAPALSEKLKLMLGLVIEPVFANVDHWFFRFEFVAGTGGCDLYLVNHMVARFHFCGDFARQVAEGIIENCRAVGRLADLQSLERGLVRFETTAEVFQKNRLRFADQV